MKQPFEWPGWLIYPAYTQMGAYPHSEPGSLNGLLYALCRIARQTGELNMHTYLPAFNTAYHLAVVVYNTQDPADCDLERDIMREIDRLNMQYPQEYTDRYGEQLTAYGADCTLIIMMTYAILYMQKNLPPGMGEFLSQLKTLYDGEYIDLAEKCLEKIEAVKDFVDNVETDLYPFFKPSAYKSEAFQWIADNLEYSEIRELLFFCRTIEEQTLLLDKIAQHIKRNLFDDLPF